MSIQNSGNFGLKKANKIQRSKVLLEKKRYGTPFGPKSINYPKLVVSMLTFC